MRRDKNNSNKLLLLPLPLPPPPPPPPLDQLMKATYENCKRSIKNLRIAWTDYQKAFNSIPHSWVEKSIELVGVDSKIVIFCKSSVEKWNNASVKNKARRNAAAAHSDAKRRLLLALTFLYGAYSINRADCGKISHLLYTDDLKLLGRYGDDFENKIKIEEAISTDIKMNFGLGKCAEICLKQGRVQSKTYIGSAFEKDM